MIHRPSPDWFERLTGFRETAYDETRERLMVTGDRLLSLVNGRHFGIGYLELAKLSDLRQRVAAEGRTARRLRVRAVSGDARELHQKPELAGALFQVASQFNMLEMTGPDRTPEHGVTAYAFDRTQGPACAIAAGAATIYRNYFVPIGSVVGQRGTKQLDGLEYVGTELARALGTTVDALWTMRNGYACATATGLERINTYLATLSPEQFDDLRGRLQIGVQWNVEVTDAEQDPLPVVTQAFCSALPVAYTSLPAARWEPFARLVLEAAYEATLWAGVCNARARGSKIVLLTFVGGGAFGNDEDWIHAAIRRALQCASGFDLDVRLVCYGAPPESVTRFVREFE